jgi:hypothetical protein
MFFEYTASSGFDFIKHFAQKFNISLQTDGLIIPKTLGSGYCKRYIIENGFITIVHKLNLKHELTLKRVGSDKDKDTLIFRFYLYSNSYNVYYLMFN